jgi:hypothetical protein
MSMDEVAYTIDIEINIKSYLLLLNVKFLLTIILISLTKKINDVTTTSSSSFGVSKELGKTGIKIKGNKNSPKKSKYSSIILSNFIIK